MHRQSTMKKTSFSGFAVMAFFLASVATVVNPSAAFSPQKQIEAWQQKNVVATPSSRRAFFGKFSESAYATAIIGFVLQELPESANAAIKTGAASAFTGDYDDPNHPGCLRQVKVVGAPMNGVSGTRSAFPVIEITGWDGPDGSKACTTRPPSREDLWEVKGSVKSSSSAVIDFSLKSGPPDLLAKYEDGGIVFPDGNKWKKVSEKKDRRPKEMSTLSSGPKFRERDDDDDY